MANRFGPIFHSTKENGKTTSQTGKDVSCTRMVMFMRDTGRTEKEMAKENLTVMTHQHFMGSGLRTRWMVRVYKKSQMEANIKGILFCLFSYFLKGKRHGKGKLELENDEIFEGDFDDGEFTVGKGKLNLNDGKIYEGAIKGRKMDG